MKRWIQSLIAFLLILAGCSTGGQTANLALPLATDQPTLLFFFTDN